MHSSRQLPLIPYISGCCNTPTEKITTLNYWIILLSSSEATASHSRQLHAKCPTSHSRQLHAKCPTSHSRQLHAKCPTLHSGSCTQSAQHHTPGSCTQSAQHHTPGSCTQSAQQQDGVEPLQPTGFIEKPLKKEMNGKVGWKRIGGEKFSLGCLQPPPNPKGPSVLINNQQV